MRKLSRGYSWYSNCIQIFFVFCSKYEYIYSYIYIHILYAFLHATLTKLYLEVSWVRFSRSCNLDFLWHPFGSVATCHIHLSLCTAGWFRFRCRALKDIPPISFSPFLRFACNNSNCEISMPLAGHKVRQSHKSCHVVATRWKLLAATACSLLPPLWLPPTFIVTFTLRSSSCVTHTADSSHSSKKARIMPHWNSHNATSQANYDKNYSNNNSNKSCATYMKTISIKICASFLTGKSDEAVEQAEEELVDNDERKQFVCPSDAWLIFYKHKLLFSSLHKFDIACEKKERRRKRVKIERERVIAICLHIIIIGHAVWEQSDFFI